MSKPLLRTRDLHPGCARQGGVCDCGSRPCAINRPRIYNRRIDTDIPFTAVLVDRTTPFGNNFKASVWGQDVAVDKHREWIMQPEQADLRALIKESLAGRELICWCWPDRCHAETLREIANS